MRFLVWFVAPAALLAAEVRTMTLAEAVRAALAQNPEIVLARLEEQQSALAVRVARDPFVPKVSVGSGLAYSSGFPMSIEGSSPSIFEARAISSIYNAQQKFQVAQARENQRGAALDAQARREQVAWRTASLFLEADRLARVLQAARQETRSLERVVDAVAARVRDGRELPLEERRARLDVAKSRQRVEALEADTEFAERSLASALGLPDDSRVKAAGERTAPAVPQTEEAAADLALQDNREVRRLESALLAKQLEARSHRAARLPSVDLVAQYALFAKFNNYEDYFRKFQRHNGQLGVSFVVPLATGPAVAARTAAAEAEVTRLKTEVNRARNRIALDARRAHQDLRKASAAAEIARQDLELEREAVSILLAQFAEGRTPLRQVEQGRRAEQEKWIALLDAQFTVEKARLELLRTTGGLMAALQ